MKTKKKQLEKILLIHPVLVPYRIEIFNFLSEISLLTLALTKRNSDIGYFHEDDFIPILKTEPIFAKKNYSILGMEFSFGVFGFLKNTDANIVITTEYSFATICTMVYRLILRKKFNHIVLTDDNVELIRNDFFRRKVIRKLVLKLIYGVILINEEAEKYYINELRFNGLTCVTPIIHDEKKYLNKLKDSKVYAPDYIKKYNLKDKNVVLFVGRLIPAKRVDLLIDSFSLVVKNNPKAVLVIVGEGPELNNLTQKVSHFNLKNHVHFAGKYEDVKLAAWYTIAKVFALPSDYEPFGVVINEALIAGLPCVVSHNVGAKSLISEGSGSVVNVHDQDLFAREIIKWLENNSLVGNSRGTLMALTFGKLVNRLQRFIFDCGVKHI